jgi:YD repeat-containing protein
MRFSTPSSRFLPLGAALLIATAAGIVPRSVCATPVASAANIPYSGISPGGVDMATGEIIIVARPDLAIDGPFPVEFGRYYASMLTREGFASSHLSPNWLGTYDWSLSATPTAVSIVSNRGQRIQFQQSPVGGWDLVSPTDEKYRLDFVGGSWRLTHPGLRQIFLFDGTSQLLMQILDEHGNALSLSYSGGRLSQVSDGLGRTLTFGYDATGFLILVGDGTRSVSYSYAGGLLTGAIDAAGHAWAYSYTPPGSHSPQGLLVGVTEPLGNTPFTQSYDTSGRVVSQTDAFGTVASYAYDVPSGGCVYHDGLGNPWTYLHDTQNRLSMLTDPVGNPTSYQYDPLGRPSMVTRPMGDMTSFIYDPASGYPSMVGFADGTAINWGYGSHLVGGATLFDLSTAGYADGTSEGYIRDAAGNLTDFTDQSGAHWLGTFNARGQILTSTNPTSGVTTFTYDPQGRPATAMDNAGNTAAFTYDALSRLTQVAWPDTHHRNYAYDGLNHLASLTDERGKVWGYAYDEDGRLVSAIDPLFETTGFVHDALDRVTQVVDPLGHASGYAYDPAGRLMSVTDRSGRTTSYQYDTVGRLTGIVDPVGATTTYSYDADSRVPAVQDALQHTVGFGYDPMDRITHMTDPVGTGFDYMYDLMGRLHTANAPLGRSQTFNYDPRGLLASYFDVGSETDSPRTPLGEVSQITDPNRQAWSRSYDPQGRLTSAADPLTRTTSYSYDALSRPIHVGRPDGTVQQIDYDPAGRMTGESYTDGTSFTFTYDDANRLTGATGASFAYDAAGRMISSNGFAMTYDDEGRILSETLAPGKVVTYAYDNRGLPAQVMDWMGGTTSFTYDAADRLTGITRPNGTTGTYTYDAADRLTSAVEKQPGPSQTTLSSISITRDALGQPISINRRQPLMPGQTVPSSAELTYDPASELNGVGHDPLGRTTGDASRSFQWNGASLLTHYAAGADSPRFTYDAFGSPLTSTQGNQTVHQVWNYWRGVPDMDDTQVNLPAPKTSYYVHAPSGLLLYSVDGSTGARRFYHYDEAGNTIFLTDDGGSVAAQYAYTPFGGVAALGQTIDNPFTWNAAAGATQLGSSGLFDTGHGIYDAVTMRVISGTSTQSGSGSGARTVDNFPAPVPLSGGSGVAEIQGNDAIVTFAGPSFLAPGGRVTRDYAGSFMHEIGHSTGLSHGGGQPGTGSPNPWETVEFAPNVGNTIAVNDDMPVPIPPWYFVQRLAPASGGGFGVIKSDGSHIGGGAFGGGYDPGLGAVAIGPTTDGDRLPDPWETSGRVDLDCDGTYDGGGGGTFDPRRGYSKRYAVFGHNVNVRPPDDSSIVISPPGAEIYTDKHGRIKVQFFWDRTGTKDPGSSRWIRTTKPSGGWPVEPYTASSPWRGPPW